MNSQTRTHYVPTKLCPKCGAEITVDALRCPQCEATFSSGRDKHKGIYVTGKVLISLVIAAYVYLFITLLQDNGNYYENSTEFDFLGMSIPLPQAIIVFISLLVLVLGFFLIGKSSKAIGFTFCGLGLITPVLFGLYPVIDDLGGSGAFNSVAFCFPAYLVIFIAGIIFLKTGVRKD